jgi:hypothetical protein
MEAVYCKNVLTDAVFFAGRLTKIDEYVFECEHEYNKISSRLNSGRTCLPCS